MPLRIGIAQVHHRSNTFVPGRTGLADFGRLTEDAVAVSEQANAATVVGGALAACAAIDAKPVPLLVAGATAGPVVSASAWAHLRDQLLARIDEAGVLDGVVLALSGAMVVEDLEDPESELLAAVRERVDSLPIAVVLDLQANPGAGLLEDADIVVGSRAYPGADGNKQGVEAVGLLASTIEGALAPAVVGRRLPLLTCPLGQATDEEPMASLLVLAQDLQARPGVARVSLFPGFPYADIERLGFSVVVTGEVAAANEVAEELAAAVWQRRAEFERALVPVEEAVERALAAPGAVVLADVADSVEGGAPGNSAHVLRALLEAGAGGAVVVLHDAQALVAAQGGGEMELEVGEPSLTLAGRVVGSELGWAVVQAGGVDVVLTSGRVLPSAEHLRAVGVEPRGRQALAVKSAVAWRAAFDAISDAINVDVPGPTAGRLATLPYERAPRPIAPLDDF